jgi:hypothetical protein
MLLAIALSIMFISSISVILYVDYFTALNEKEIKKVAIQNKIREPLQSVITEEDESIVLVEAV